MPMYIATFAYIYIEVTTLINYTMWRFTLEHVLQNNSHKLKCL